MIKDDHPLKEYEDYEIGDIKHIEMIISSKHHEISKLNFIRFILIYPRESKRSYEILSYNIPHRKKIIREKDYYNQRAYKFKRKITI